MFRLLTTTCIVLLGLAIVVVGQEPHSAPSAPEVKIAGALVATIKNGDFVHPTFSPDAKRLAYSRVITRKDFESTDVSLYDLSTHKRLVLLNSRKAERYATYKVFVSGMQWESRNRLQVSVGDGDVDGTDLIFDPVTRKLLKETHHSFDDADLTELSSSDQKAYQHAHSVFPSFPADGKLSRLGEFDFKGSERVEMKHVSPSRLIFLIRTHAPYDRGDNPLYVFDGSKLFRVRDYAELHDAAVDPAGRRIAFCHWVGDQRHIEVRELK